MNKNDKTIAVAYLARVKDSGWRHSFKRFVDSYMRCRPGINHKFYVLFKGLSDVRGYDNAISIFKSVNYIPIYLEDNHFDIGAYMDWANAISEDIICVFNSNSELLCNDWLKKLSLALTIQNVGLVGATASYESLYILYKNFPKFPNPHIRSNAFMIDRELFCRITNGLKIDSKMDAHGFESGAESMTRKVLREGLRCMLVGSNGRAYSIMRWPTSGTFRQGTQHNLMVADNQTRSFQNLPWMAKSTFVKGTWGEYIQMKKSKRATDVILNFDKNTCS